MNVNVRASLMDYKHIMIPGFEARLLSAALILVAMLSTIMLLSYGSYPSWLWSAKWVKMLIILVYVHYFLLYAAVFGKKLDIEIYFGEICENQFQTITLASHLYCLKC